MRKLITYSSSQYDPLNSKLKSKGFRLMSLLEFSRSDQIAELPPGEALAVDISSFVGLFSGSHLIISNLEFIIHEMPPETVFICDETAASEGAYRLRTMFDDIRSCGIEVSENHRDNIVEKRTLISLDENEFNEALATLDNELIGQVEFKHVFATQSRTFRLFNAIDEQPILSLLLLGPSGVGKTEVAKILCEAVSPGHPLPKINFGNYSSRDSLNSLIGSPRGYIGSEEGELSRAIDSSEAGILLVDEFEKADPAVWNFFLDLLETGCYSDSQGIRHDLHGFIIVFTTNCPREKLEDTFPAELLSRFSLKSVFSRLSTSDKKLFVERYVSRVAERCQALPPERLPTIPENIVERARTEINVEATDNIRILKNITRSWIGTLFENIPTSNGDVMSIDASAPRTKEEADIPLLCGPKRTVHN